jgi:tetratricopeptide (TPR) repeat protein
MLEERSPEENILQEAQIALQKGEKGRARDLLTRLIKSNKASAQLWLLMSAAVDTNKERIFCLGEVLRHDPQNQHARRGLIALGARPPEEGLGIPLAVQKRNWEAAFFGRVSPESEAANRAMRQLAVVAGLVIVFIAAIVIAVIAGRGAGANNAIPLPPTSTRGPTVTYVATASPVVRSPTPTFTGPTPLAMILNLNYTPTPQYVTTPHNLEDYNRGLRMVRDGNWAQAIISFQNAVQAAPNSADIYYLMGEVYRFQKKYTEAGQNYDKALKIDPNFAPAYLGRARWRQVFSPDNPAVAQPDLEKAISLDPKLFEAYLELAEVKIAGGDGKGALKDLGTAASLNPVSTLLYYERAQAELLQDNPTQALADARLANHSDLTYLPAYRLVAEALRANDDPVGALPFLVTYTTYVTDDPMAFLWLGEAHVKNIEPQSALDAFSQAIDLDNKNADAYLQRGLLYLDLPDGKKAAADFRAALLLHSNSFDASLGWGRANLVAGDYKGAADQLNSALRLAQTDADKASVYYYRAQALEKAGTPLLAIQVWQALLKLPTQGISSAWLATAHQHLQDLYTPTPAVSPTR